MLNGELPQHSLFMYMPSYSTFLIKVWWYNKIVIFVQQEESQEHNASMEELSKQSWKMSAGHP